MRHDWIADILAVIDTGSFSRAAEVRNITLSAFTRRIDVIETFLGGTLFDRQRKPVALRPAVVALEPRLRAAKHAQEALLQEVAGLARGGSTITLACQHAISATLSPRLVHTLTDAGMAPVRVRSGNHDECLLMLLSGAADLLIGYAPAGASIDAAGGFERHCIGTERLLPVARPGSVMADQETVPVIAYPPDVFFGKLVAEVWATLAAAGLVLRPVVETALTLAAYRYALEGLAVAWLPAALVQGDLAAGRLVPVPQLGPDIALDILMIRAEGTARDVAGRGWAAIVAGADMPALSG